KTGDQSSAGAKPLGIFGEQRLHARGEGGRNGAVELLVDHRLQQRLEDALRGFLLQAAFTRANDDPRQPAIGPRKMFQGGGVVEFSWHNAVASCQWSVVGCRLLTTGYWQLAAGC